MEIYPKTLDEFEEWFSSESACRDYLISLRWPNGFSCERCGHEKCWAMANGLYQCSRCGFQNSITAGTIFQDKKSHLLFGFGPCGISPVKSMGQTPWGYRGFSDSGATGRLGHGCISFDVPWCDPDETSFLVKFKSMNPTLAERNPEKEGRGGRRKDSRTDRGRRRRFAHWSNPAP